MYPIIQIYKEIKELHQCYISSQLFIDIFNTAEQKFSVTFFQRPDHLDLTVSSLELIKERAHFEFVDGTSLQLTDHHPVLPWGVYFQDTPLPLWLAVLSGYPVKHLVTLDVCGLLLNLVEMQR